MANILIYSSNPHLISHWTHALMSENSVSMLNNIFCELNADALLIDARKLDEDASIETVFTNPAIRSLVIGTNWPEQKQIRVMVQGAAGYCEESAPAELVERAVHSVLSGEIWIKRRLVPKIIGALTSVRQFQGPRENIIQIDEVIKKFDTLSGREIEVAEMIQTGENNKRIALVLNISERTVKAHLSSIFRKLEVEDRLHLAIILKELEQHRKVIS